MANWLSAFFQSRTGRFQRFDSYLVSVNYSILQIRFCHLKKTVRQFLWCEIQNHLGIGNYIIDFHFLRLASSCMSFFALEKCLDSDE